MSGKSKEKRKLWARRLHEWQESGVSGAAWCKAHDINYKQFVYWRHSLAAEIAIESAKAASPRDSFVEIVHEPTTSADVGVVIEYRGAVLRLTKGFDQPTLNQCLQALRALPC